MMPRPRHAEIAGAGFAGLTSAIALSQRGWVVRVHEKSNELREFGAGLVLWENGLSALRAIGAYDDVMEGSMTPPYYETIVDSHTVSKEAFSFPWRAMTRPHLYRSLLAAAIRSGVEFAVGSEVIGASPAGVLHLASGAALQADLVVGADGVRSRVRDSLDFEQRRQSSHDGIVRLLIPRLKDKLGDGEWDNVVDFWNLHPRFLRILYVPCNERELYIAFTAPRDDAEGSRVPIDLDVWSESFPRLRPLIEVAATLPGRYDVYETTVVKSWTDGKVALVGDAAHAMTPSLAQGANSAMFNALALAEDVDTASSVEDALPQWEKRVRPSTDRYQAHSAHLTEKRALSHGDYATLLQKAKL